MNLQGRILNFTDERYMDLAISEAEKSRGLCSPNPFVGAILVKDGSIIAKGRTQAYGKDHAEVDALKKAGNQALGATMYVSLEPCCHFGKTPPCTQAIIKAGIKKVVAGITDPNPRVAGKGFAELRQAGIEVVQGVREDKIRRQNEAFLCYIQNKRPFIIWKSALSWDGKYAASDGSSQWITNEKARNLVHTYRAASDAVLAGIRSVHVDDAMLNARGVRGAKQALRVVLDPQLDLDPGSRFAQSAMQYPSLVFHQAHMPDKQKRLNQMGIDTIRVAGNPEAVDLDEVLRHLYQLQISTLLLEAGSQLSESFFRKRLVDKCLLFLGNKILGGERAMLSGLKLPSIDKAINLLDVQVKQLEGNILLIGYPEWQGFCEGATAPQ